MLFRETIGDFLIVVEIICAIVIKVNIRGHMQIYIRIGKVWNLFTLEVNSSFGKDLYSSTQSQLD